MPEHNPYQAPAASLDDIPGLAGEDQTSVFSPRGRFGRLSYLSWTTVIGVLIWLVALVLELAVWGMSGAQRLAAGSFPNGVMGVLFFAGGIVTLYCYLVFVIRRLHDVNMSGWFALAFLVPMINLVMALLVLILPGSDGNNRFGPPRATAGWEKVLGILILLLSITAIVLAIAIPAYQQYLQQAAMAG